MMYLYPVEPHGRASLQKYYYNKKFKHYERFGYFRLYH